MSNEHQTKGNETSTTSHAQGNKGGQTSSATGNTSIDPQELDQLRKEASASKGRAKKVTDLEGKLSNALQRLDEIEESGIAKDDEKGKTAYQLKKERRTLQEELDNLKARIQELEPYEAQAKEREQMTAAEKQIAKLLENVEGLSLANVLKITGGDIERAKAFITEYGKSKGQTSQTVPDSSVTIGGGKDISGLNPKETISEGLKKIRNK